MGLLILLIAMGIGFGAGYGVREMISRRRRRAARGDKRQSHWGDAAVAGTGTDAINLERLLVAANDDVTGRRRQHQPAVAQPVNRNTRPDEEFDGAVRDLLGALNRRPPDASTSPREARP
ncbi:hypothetical protein J6500_18825 [Bradyrhizobium sp. WSM 1704]|uniref:hypothetical protein n=1 Tax=Bradyrhizobium semiaridum TaxID=2821404 RepID=UPI001CE30E10|nr:hypothetical protein [Bradyrhizobium semiaridum]MCA6123934.1 hypothetical protein [Bradyrhizobium semiaridum]